MNNLSSYCKNHDPTGFHLQNEWRPEGARNQTYYCWSTMCTLHVSMSPFLCRTCGLYLGLPRLVCNEGHKEINFLYDCTFYLWNCNLLDSICLVLSQKHYQKQFLIMRSFGCSSLLQWNQGKLVVTTEPY